MKTYVALLRGINVGGRNALPMKELAALLEGLSLRNVTTYIQSGNVVFQIAAGDSRKLAGKIATAIRKHRGLEPHVLVLERACLTQIIAANPFPEAEADPKSLHVGFLDSVPASPDLAKLEELKAASERFQLIGRCFYLHAPDGVGRSKLAAKAEKFLGVPMTDRNWRTVCKLNEMAHDVD